MFGRVMRKRVVKLMRDFHCFFFLFFGEKVNLYSSLFCFFLSSSGTCLPSVRPLMTGWPAGTSRAANRRWSSSAERAEPEKRRPPSSLCNTWPLSTTARSRAGLHREEVRGRDPLRRSWRSKSSRLHRCWKASATPQPSATTTRLVSANTRRFSLESEL